MFAGFKIRAMSTSMLSVVVVAACAQSPVREEPPTASAAAAKQPAAAAQGIGDQISINSTSVPGFDRPINTAASAPLASIDATTGKLHYGRYANEGQTNADHIIPDFSFAGYGGGGVPLPPYASIPVLTTLSPQAGDNYSQIQNALDAAASAPADCRGIRGAVMLNAGTYEVGTRLVIPASGVILRGAGQGANGTIIRGTMTTPEDILVYAEGTGSGQNPTSASPKLAVDITQAYVPVGSNTIEVSSTAGYSVGDHIAIHRIPNDDWIGPTGVDMEPYDWEASQYDVSFQRTVTAINGNTLHFDIPIVDTIEAQYGGGEVYRIDTSGRLSHIGIENLRLETLEYSDVSRRDRAVDAVSFEEVEHSWIRDVTVRYFSHGFDFHDGVHFVTAQNVAHIDTNFVITGGNHYAFNIEGGGMNLFQRCYADSSRHAFTSGSRTTGPNVFLDCIAINGQNDSGPHQRWAAGTLFDNTSDSLIRVQNRQDAGTGHGWAGAQQMIWNGVYDEIVLQAPPAAMNWAVGNIGTRIDGSRDPDAPDGIFESVGTMVSPRSLYLAQLEDRLGEDAVMAITTPAQRSGRLWTALETWAGEGRFETGDVVVGAANNEVLVGTTGDDTIVGAAGSDSLTGGDGNDLLVGDDTDHVEQAGGFCQ